ncbi:MAG: GGDEF domain-containing protein, partial [Chloroflexota bacterium]
MVAFLDIDALKVVNDSQGHEAGDRLLQTLVSAIHRRIRSYDSITRWGGDEFVVAFPQTDGPSAAHILREVKATFEQETGQTFSFGLAELESSDDLAAIIGRADAELYDQKRGSAAEAVGTGPPPAPAAPRRAMLDRLLGR